jgi:hypothetical protein
MYSGSFVFANATVAITVRQSLSFPVMLAVMF